MTQTNLKKNGKSNKTTLSKVLGSLGTKSRQKHQTSKPVKKPTAPKMPGEWLYLNKEELSLRKSMNCLRKSRLLNIGRLLAYWKFHYQRVAHWI